MTVPHQILPDAEAVGAEAARIIADQIDSANRDGRRFVLGCPGGRSPMSTYEALAGEVAHRDLDLRSVVIAMMDEYVHQRGEQFEPEAPEALHSCRRFGRLEIVGRLQAAATPGHELPDTAFVMPDPANPAAYDELLTSLGGIDVFILASGASDGHVAFNTPGSASESTTRVVPLPDTTRTDNLATFPSFDSLDAVPRFGVTVGIATIREQSRQAIMVVVGADKQQAYRELVDAPSYNPAWPATVLAECANPLLLADRAAANQ